MNIDRFDLERYFDERDELSVSYLLSPSDPETYRMSELILLADDESLDLWMGLRLEYTESQGHPLLREEVSRLYNNTITPDKVLICTPEEGIFITMNAILNREDRVVVTYPAYQSLSEVAEYLDCDVAAWMPNRDTWHFEIDDLKELMLNKTTKLLVINFPHNPTGELPSRREFEEIIALAQENDVFVFSDEMYRFLEYSEIDRLPSVGEVYEKGVSLCGMSKIFGLAGLRIGWLTTQDKEIFQRLVRFKDYTTICSSAPSEILALIGLRARNTIIRRNVDIIRNNLLFLQLFFEQNESLFSWVKPRAGTVAFPKLNTAVRIDRLCDDLLKKKSTLLVPGSVFHWPGNHFRIGLGRRDFPQALAQFQVYLQEIHLI